VLGRALATKPGRMPLRLQLVRHRAPGSNRVISWRRTPTVLSLGITPASTAHMLVTVLGIIHPLYPLEMARVLVKNRATI
jgi:hypothetical protein